MILATLTLIATMATANNTTCAAINNASNVAAWSTPTGQVRTSTYTDNGRLVYSDAPSPTNNAAWRSLHAAERALQAAPTGPKVKIACRR